MITKILLIRPYAIGKVEFPFGILYIGTALKSNGFNIEILDLQLDKLSNKEIFRKIINPKEMIIGISAIAPQYKWVKEFSIEIKANFPDLKIIVGGHIASAYKQLLNNSAVDYICMREGEELFPELITKLNNGESIEDVFGLAYRNNNNEIIRSKPRNSISDFLFPDFTLIDVDKYLIHPINDTIFSNSKEYLKIKKPEDKLGAVMFSRGCIGSCTFCYRHLPGFRQPQVDWCIKMISLLYNDYGIRFFRIDDELFINDPKWFNDFYNQMKASKMEIKFRITGIRSDSIDDVTLRKLKEIGCLAINYGIESGSQKILDIMKKQTNIDQNIKAVNSTVNEGMLSMVYLIFGYTGENKTTLVETALMIFNLNISYKFISIFYAVPLPGTKLYRDCLKNGLIKDEEKYLNALYSYVSEKREAKDYYYMNLSETSIIQIELIEKVILLLMHFKTEIWNNQAVIKFLFGIFNKFSASIFTLKFFKIIRKPLSFISYIKKN